MKDNHVRQQNLRDFPVQIRRMDNDAIAPVANLDSDAGDDTSAHAPYEAMLRNARSISDRAVLVEALLAHGKWQANHMKDADTAFSDGNETLGCCTEGGYCQSKTAVRVALGWADLANGEKEKAKDPPNMPCK